jgi:hypothetical protein
VSHQTRPEIGSPESTGESAAEPRSAVLGGPESQESLPYGVPCPAVGALLRACDENERHIQDCVPHLPPDAGTLSVHAIRGIIARAEPACVVTEAAGGHSEPREPSGATERLRSAADLIEQRAADASGRAWEPEYSFDSRDVQAVFVECDTEDGDCGHDRYGHVDGTCAIGCFHRAADNRWAVLAGPQLAGPLAAWLRGEAESWEAGYQAPNIDQALALVDVILGGEDQ